MQVESEVGNGSRFTINLAYQMDVTTELGAVESQQSLPASLPTTNLSAPSAVGVRRGRILLAEDNIPNILTIGEYLESCGYEVIVAHDGLEAIAKAEQVNPELILMDIQMPVLDGLEAIARLRADPQFGVTPIIALTALAMPGDRERCLQVGASEYMSKPVSLKILVNVIDTMLRSGREFSGTASRP